MATYTLVPLPRIGITPEGGMLITTYAAGGTTPAATYQDSNGAALNTNPVQADGNGLFPAIYLPLGTSYKFICTHANGVIIWTQDGIASVPASTPALDLTGTAGEAILANAAVYLSDGSGSKQAGLWYNADTGNAYSSQTPLAGFATTAIASGATGSVRVGGALAGFSALIVGGRYFVGVAGAITTTPTTNARFLGQADTTTSLIVAANPPTGLPEFICNFRLSLTTGVPVTTADVTAAGTLFCTPYNGNKIGLPDANSLLSIYQSAQFSIAVPAVASQVYSVFCYANSGVPTLELAAWTNDTTPGTAAYSLAPGLGIYTKTSDVTRLLLGLMRTTAVVSQTEDSFAKRYVGNVYNRVRRIGRVLEATDSWTYTTATYQQANAAAANQLDFVVPTPDIGLHVDVHGMAVQSTNAVAQVSIGQDSTTVPASNVVGIASQPFAGPVAAIMKATLEIYPAIGRHTYVWLERSTAAGTTTWYGDNGGATLLQAGITGWLEM